MNNNNINNNNVSQEPRIEQFKMRDPLFEIKVEESSQKFEESNDLKDRVIPFEGGG